jgi:hypothetical protein
MYHSSSVNAIKKLFCFDAVIVLQGAAGKIRKMAKNNKMTNSRVQSNLCEIITLGPKILGPC